MNIAREVELKYQFEDMKQNRQQCIEGVIEETKVTMIKFMFKRGLDINLIQDITEFDKIRLREIKKESKNMTAADELILEGSLEGYTLGSTISHVLAYVVAYAIDIQQGVERTKLALIENMLNKGLDIKLIKSIINFDKYKIGEN